MAGWSGARFGVSDASFSVVRSQLGRALRLLGEPEKRRRKRAAAPLGTAWQDLATALRHYWTEHRAASGLDYGQNWLEIRLGRFIRWCDANRVAPSEVGEATIVAYIDEVAATALRGSMAEKERGLRKAWNHCVRSIAGWPATEVATTRDPSARAIVSFPEDRFAAAFIAGLDAYRDNRGLPQPQDAEDDRTLPHLERMRRRSRAHDRPLAGDAAPARRQRLRPLARSSLYWHRRVLVMTATALVLRGVRRLEEIRSIADVACLDGAASVIDLYETRRNEAQATSPYPAQIVTALLSIIARCAIVLPAGEQVAIAELTAELNGMARGRDDTISPRNRERLSQFDDPDNFALLVSCSEHEMDRLEAERRSLGRVTLAMARRAEGAIGNLILCSLPVRRRTLTNRSSGETCSQHSSEGRPALVSIYRRFAAELVDTFPEP